MRRVTDKIDGPHIITDELDLAGMIAGDATVRGDGRLLLNGMVTGNLTIETGGSARINGMVCGNVRNDGRLDVFGTIVGKLHDTSGQAHIAPGAMIDGERH